MNYSTKRDFSPRDPDKVMGPFETLRRAQARQPGQFPPVSPRDLFSGIRPPGPTTIPVSRTPGAELSPGVEVSGARHRPAGTRGNVEQFPTVAGSAVVENALSAARYMANVHVQPGAGPDDPAVVVDPRVDDGEVPPELRGVLGYPTSAADDAGQPLRPTVRRV